MKKLSMWLAVGLGALGVAFLSGAFETLFNWDRDQSRIGTGLMTAGVALAAAYLAHSAGIIDGNTRNLLISAGVAMGATQAFGGKLYEWGAELSSKVFKKGSSANRQEIDLSGVGQHSGAGIGTPNFQPQIPDSAVSKGGATSTSPSAPAAPVYNIKYEAAKIPKPDLATTLIQTGGDVLAKFLPALVGGSKGSGNSGVTQEMALGAL